MKFSLLVLVLAIASFGALADEDTVVEIESDNNDDAPKWRTREEKMKQIEGQHTRMFDELFANFTDIFQEGRHPSVSGPIKNITMCIEDKGIKESLKSFMIASATLDEGKAKVEERRQVCLKHANIFTPLMDCISQSNEPEHDEFVGLLLRNAMNYLDVFCRVPDVSQVSYSFVEFFHFLRKNAEYEKVMDKVKKYTQDPISPRHPIVPLKKGDECVPIRIAEIYEIATIESHRIPFAFHASNAEFLQLLVLLSGPYPYKTYEECA